MNIADQLERTVRKEQDHRPNLTRTIEAIERLRNAGLIGTPTYRFPLHDTIGRRLYNATEPHTPTPSPNE